MFDFVHQLSFTTSFLLSELSSALKSFQNLACAVVKLSNVYDDDHINSELSM